MSDITLSKKINNSFKWSFVGQICAKLANPISTMILARILAPEIFGITTAVTMVISFCEIIADSGFAKYLIQHDFESKEKYEKSFSVAFYVSIFLSLIMCGIIIAFAGPISSLISNSGYEKILMFSVIQIPIYTINSMYNADLRREFKFKKIFISSLASIATPFLITVPLALLNFSYWSLVFGSIASILFQTIILTFFSKTKLKLFFSFKLFKEMFAYSISMVIEAILIWLCSWAAVFIVGKFYDAYHVGLFKVSISTVASIFAILSTTVTSVLFPSFSRLKNDEVEFKKIFVNSQKITLCIAVPLGVGALLFSKLITFIFLGSQWSDASLGIGLISMAFALKCCYSYFLSEVFRSKGNYVHSIIFQALMFIIQIILFLTLGKISYDWAVYSYLISNLSYVVVSIIYLIAKYKFNLIELIKPLKAPLISSIFMFVLFLPSFFFNYGFLQQIGIILIMSIGYFSFMAIFFRKSFKEVVAFVLRK